MSPRYSGFIVVLTFISLISGDFYASAQSVERLIKGAPAQLSPLKTPHGRPMMEDAALIVTDVLIDKTAENVVVAREQAMTEARRVAFQKLLEQNMTPSEFRSFRMPSDTVIATLVQDFEIKGEQLSTTRYVANFTVRFRDVVRRYVNVPYQPRVAATPAETFGRPSAATTDTKNPPAETSAADAPVWNDLPPGQIVPDAPVSETTTPASSVPRVAGTALILPYYENMAGKTVLWDDPNPWRSIWQKMPPRPNAGTAQLIVPLGDIADVAAGSADAVWSGDYKTVEKLRQQYGAAQVVVAVANKSGAYMTIDLYFYKDGKLQRRNALTPYVGERTEHEAWQQAMYEVVSYMQRPAPPEKAAVENISRQLTGSRPDTGTGVNTRPSLVTTSTPYGQPPYGQAAYGQPPYGQIASATTSQNTGGFSAGTEVEAMLAFDSFSVWMDVQRRLSSISPPVRVDIRSISSSNARFTLRYDGNVELLRSALAAQGIVMNAADTAGYGQPVYRLRVAQ